MNLIKVKDVITKLKREEGHKTIKYIIIKFGLLIGLGYFFIKFIVIPSTKLIDSYHSTTDILPVLSWAFLVMSSCIFLVFPFQEFICVRICKVIKCIPDDSITERSSE